MKNYRSLPIPVRAATALIVARAGGVVEKQAEARSLQIAPEPPPKREAGEKRWKPRSLFD